MNSLDISVSSLFEEQINHNGNDMKIQYVVKQTPFRIAISSNPTATAKQLQLSLILDGDDDEEDVVYLGTKPFEYKIYAQRKGEASAELGADIRIKVLSTQFDNSLFRLKAVSGNRVGYSDPIRVVSKPDQIRKKRREANQEPLEMPSCKKRARSEDLIEALSEIRQTQIKSLQLLKRLSKGGPASSFPLKMEDDEESGLDNDNCYSSSDMSSPSSPASSSVTQVQTLSPFAKDFCSIVGLFQSMESRSSDPLGMNSAAVEEAVSAAVSQFGHTAMIRFASAITSVVTRSSDEGSEDQVPTDMPLLEAQYSDFLI